MAYSDGMNTTTQDDAQLLSKQGKLTNAEDEPTASKLNADTMDIPQGGDTIDNSYASFKNEPVPVLKDEEPVEQPNDAMDPDSDKMLGKLSRILFLDLERAIASLLNGLYMTNKEYMLIGGVEQDEREAIDRSNILEGDRTRHIKKPAGTYRDPGDEEGLPGPDDGTSNVRGTGVEGAYDNKPNAPDPFIQIGRASCRERVF